MAKTLTRSMTYDSLVAEIVAGTLNKGEKITITDFATKHYVLDGDDVYLDAELNPEIITGVTEPLTVTALSNNTISHEATSELYPQDRIHYDWNPANWIYDIAFANHDQAVLTGFKGVIYFRHDTKNDVSMGYDFRNVKFRRWNSLSSPSPAVATYVEFESTSSNASNINDYIDVLTFNCPGGESQYNQEVHGIKFNCLREDTSRSHRLSTILLNNVFMLGDINHSYDWFQVFGNTYGYYCAINTFIGYSEGNIIGTYFFKNVIGDNFSGNQVTNHFMRNRIGNDCIDCFFETDFKDNNISDDFQNNYIGKYFQENIINGNFQYNIIDSSFIENTVGNNFMYNNIKSGIDGKTFNCAQGSLVTQLFSKDIYKASDGSVKLSYIKEEAGDYTLAIVDYNA